MKINVLIQETKIITRSWARMQILLRTDVSRNAKFTRMLNMQLSLGIAECAIRFGLAMDRRSFGQNK